MKCGACGRAYRDRRAWLIPANHGIDGLCCAHPTVRSTSSRTSSAFFGRGVCANSQTLTNYLLDEAQVAVIPGSAVRQRRPRPHQLRDLDGTLQEGVRRIESALKKATLRPPRRLESSLTTPRYEPLFNKARPNVQGELVKKATIIIALALAAPAVFAQSKPAAAAPTSRGNHGNGERRRSGHHDRRQRHGPQVGIRSRAENASG